MAPLMRVLIHMNCYSFYRNPEHTYHSESSFPSAVRTTTGVKSIMLEVEVGVSFATKVMT